MFRFRLARVLKYRQLRQEQIEQEFRQKHEQLERQETFLASLRHHASGVEGHLSGSEGTTLLGDEVDRWHHYYRLLDDKIVTQEEVTTDAREALEASRQKLLQARRETKTLERLQSKLRQRHAQEQERRAQRLLDDIVRLRSRYGH